MLSVPLKAIFYDLDGTLVYFKIDWMKGRLVSIKLLEEAGIPKGKYTVKDSIRGSIEDARKYMEEVLGYEKERIDEIIGRINGALIEVEKEAAFRAEPVPGIPELLRKIHGLGIKQIIVTFNTHDVARLSLEVAGIDGYIDDIIGRDDVSRPKPDPYHIRVAAEKYGIKPEESIMVGDHHNDIIMGKTFGCYTIGVKHDQFTKEQNLDDADTVVNQHELAECIIKILKNKFGVPIEK